MQALMLAAGLGKRLAKYTKNNTKCMVEVAGQRLIDRAITAIKKAGISFDESFIENFIHNLRLRSGTAVAARQKHLLLTASGKTRSFTAAFAAVGCNRRCVRSS